MLATQRGKRHWKICCGFRTARVADGGIGFGRERNYTTNSAASKMENETGGTASSTSNTQENPTSSSIANKQYRLCSDPWKIMYINAKGGFDTCCFRHDDVTETLKDYSLNEIWYNSVGLNKVRNDLRQGHLDEVCAGCTVRTASDHPPEIPEKWAK